MGMMERKALLDQNETPEDVASLYTWANLHGAKYRDFSAARAQAREKSQLRVQKAAVEERERVRVETEVEQAQLLEAELAPSVPQQARQTVHVPVVEPVRPMAMPAPEAPTAQMHGTSRLVEPFRGTEAPVVESDHVQQTQQVPQPVSEQQPLSKQAQRAELPHIEPQTYPQGSFFAAQGTSELPAAIPSSVERGIWGMDEERESLARPAWLNPKHDTEPLASSVPQTEEEGTLQASRDRLASRWYALKGVFAGGSVASEQTPVVSQAPVVAVFSLAGGVGKTSMVATLGRALSSRGERVLLVDTASYGLLPFYFGARDQRPGQLRTFTPPGASGDAPIQMIAIDPDTLGPEKAPQEPLTAEIGKYAGGVSRVLVDLATASGATTRRVLRMSPMVLVPVAPDMNSVVSVHAIETFFQRSVNGSGAGIKPFYVLNQFDPSLPLHLDVREVLREQLGDRLLSFALRRTPAVSEALAEGMTVMDYAPASTVAEDYGNLAGWVKNQSAPLSAGFRGVRWSER